MAKPNFGNVSLLLFGRSALEEGLYEGFLVEYLKLVDALAYADKADRDLKLIGDAEGYAALCCTIEFGQR